MKCKVIRHYPNRPVDKGFIDVEDSLFEKGTMARKLSCEALGMFMELKCYDKQIVDIYKLSSDNPKTTDKALLELIESGLIKSMDVVENGETIKMLYLQNPDEVLK